MKISIGHRLFAAVLLAILAVTATGIALMRNTLATSFSTYAVEIELDRLQQLSDDLAGQYRHAGSWRFVPANAAQRRGWISAQLRRLQDGSQPLSSAAPEAPASLAPPVPPLPPAPPLPPLPPPALADDPAPPADMDIDTLPLQQRITLSDASGHYLAGRIDAGEATVRRPLRVGGAIVGYLGVAQANRPSDAMASAFLARMRTSAMLIVALSVILSALAAMLLAAHFRAPIRRLAEGARALAEGRYATRVELDRSDELGELAQRFNQMAGRLGVLEATRRQWVADTSHELRTPLSVLRAQLEAIQDGVRSASADTVAAMLRQVMALSKLIDDLYTLAQSDAGELTYQRELLDAWQATCEAVAASQQRFEAAGLRLDIDNADIAAPVLADPDRLRQVLANLLENSMRYTSAPGRVLLQLHVLPEQGEVSIVIDDSAPAVPEADLARLGERLFRVEGSRSRAHGGAGLGLALCQRIVAAHGGRLTFAASTLGGLRVCLTLPLAAA